MTEQHRVDPALASRMRDPAFARAYDVWLLVLAQQAAEIDLARSGLRHKRPQGSRAMRNRANRGIPRIA